MKKIFCCYAFLLALYSCSPKIGSVVVKPLAPLPDTAFVLVLQKQDSFVNDGVEIGMIKSGDNGFSTHCTYREVIGQLKQLARSKGANLIKIVHFKNPDNWSSCVRLSAKIYNVPDIRVHEKEIEWSENRKLTWQDFKGKPKESSSTAALSACEFGFRVSRPSVFHKFTLVTKATFDCYLSWAHPNQRHRSELLQHEQTHFDLCELYARKLRKRLEENKLTAAKVNQEAYAIFKEVYREYLDHQDKYDTETNFSRNPGKQAEWSASVNDQLNQLVAYQQQ